MMGFWRRGAARDHPAPPASGPARPHIDRDYCSGCSACVDACAPGCLALQWSFATLVRPDACTGEGACVRACPEGLIRMAPSGPLA